MMRRINQVLPETRRTKRHEPERENNTAGFLHALWCERAGEPGRAAV